MNPLTVKKPSLNLEIWNKNGTHQFRAVKRSVTHWDSSDEVFKYHQSTIKHQNIIIFI